MSGFIKVAAVILAAWLLWCWWQARNGNPQQSGADIGYSFGGGQPTTITKWELEYIWKPMFRLNEEWAHAFRPDLTA